MVIQLQQPNYEMIQKPPSDPPPECHGLGSALCAEENGSDWPEIAEIIL
jgi:hypothetical protein